jgi:ribose 5-phosphate isomerase
MTGRDDMKRAAARAALDELPRQGVIELSSGSTAFMFLEASLPRAIAVARVADRAGIQTTKEMSCD